MIQNALGKKAIDVYEGICIFPDAYQIEHFNYNPDEWEPYVLSNGRIIDTTGEALKRIIFDFAGDGNNDRGFVRGHIYNDGKFIGNAHYNAPSTDIPEFIAGTYKFINNGIEIKGIWDSQGNKYGFFIRLQKMNQGDKSQKPPGRKMERRKLPGLYGDVFDTALLDNLTKRAEQLKRKAFIKKFDHYDYIIKLKPKPDDFENVIIAVSIAYSWMPTMLDLYLTKKEQRRMVDCIQVLGSIYSLKSFGQNEEKIAESLAFLTDAINHSIVGVSKTLHIFYPKRIPIIDSRVLRSWNKLFKSKFKKYPELSFPATIPLKTQSMVSLYMKYWKALLQWSAIADVKDIRKIEEPLYWLGGKTK